MLNLKFKVYHKLFDNDIYIIKLPNCYHQERLVEWSKGHYADAPSLYWLRVRIPLAIFFILMTNIFTQFFLRFLLNEKGEHHFIVHSDALYTALFSHTSCTLNFYITMTETSAHSDFSLKGGEKAISILQNFIKVMVVLKINTL